MKRLAMSFKEGVTAGNTGRPITCTLLIDDEDKYDLCAHKGAAVVIQDKTRKNQVGWSYDEVNGAEIPVSKLFLRAPAQVTPQSAAKVFSQVDIETKIEMLYEQGLDSDGVRGVLTSLLKNEKITQEDYDLGVELIEMANE